MISLFLFFQAVSSQNPLFTQFVSNSGTGSSISACPSNYVVISGGCNATIPTELNEIDDPNGWKCQLLNSTTSVLSTSLCILSGIRTLVTYQALATGSGFAPCPANTTVVGGGCSLVEATALSGSFLGYPDLSSNRYICDGGAGAGDIMIQAQCVDSSSVIVVNATSSDYYTSITCPDATYLVGGGCMPTDYTTPLSSFPLSTTTWTCGGNSVQKMAIAVCADATFQLCDESYCNNHGSCYGWTCECWYNYDGTLCDSCRTPDYYNYPNCTLCNALTCNNRGTCNSTGHCVCDPPFTGGSCYDCYPDYYPPGICNLYCDWNLTCNSHGECLDSGTCFCDPGYAGENCTECDVDHYNYPNCVYCDHNDTCRGYGTCNSNGTCDCYNGFAGTACTACTTNHYNWPNCTLCSRESNCSGHGECGKDLVCACDPHFAGAKCDSCSSSSSDYPSCSKLSPKIVAPIVISVLFLTVVAVGAGYFYWRKRRVAQTTVNADLLPGDDILRTGRRSSEESEDLPSPFHKF